MVTDARSRLRQAAKLAVALLVVGPVLVAWGFVEVDLLPAVPSELLVRLAGLGIVAVVVALLVRQKRRSRGKRSSRDAPERPDDRRSRDREVEGSGEVYAPYAYNNQRQARRESERIRDRAEEIAEADRDARKR